MPYRRSSWIVLAALLAATAMPADGAMPFAGKPVSDAALDDMRGGFELPNGMNISIGVEIDTIVNGSTVLRTQLSGSDGSTLQIFSGGPTVNVSPANGGNGLTVHLASAASSDGSSASNGQALPLTPNGASIVTDAGSVRLVQSNGQSTVLLDGNGMSLQHMIGALTGALVANQASDRTIDTNITVNLAVTNSAIPTGSMLMRLNSVLLAAGTRTMM